MTVSVYRSLGAINASVVISYAESLKIIFPSSYIEIISTYNWLRLNNDTFDFTDLSGQKNDRDINFYGYEQESYMGSGTIIDAQDFDVYGYDKVVAIGFSASGDYICFDYRQNPTIDNPPVVLMYHDQYVNDEHGQPKMAIVKIADYFDSFIHMLYE